MKNRFSCAVALATMLASVAIAENNGVFVGVEIGSIGAKGTAKGTDLVGNVWDVKYPFQSAIYGAKVGYKHFFTPSIGIRGYVGLNYTSDNNQAFSGSVDFSATTATNYVENRTLSIEYSSLVSTINADVLFNFYNNEQNAFGAFVGLGLGYANNSAKTQNLVKQLGYNAYGNESYVGELDASPSGFYADAKVGLRASSGHNSMDLFALIPFTKNSVKFNGLDIGFSQSYRIMLAYNYAF